MKKTIKWLVLLIVIMGFAITTVVYADNTHNHNGWNEWTSTDRLPTDAGNYYLANDVTLSATWTVPTGTVNLCLNGKGIKRDTSSSNKFSVITVQKGANLTVYDCGTAEHKYTVNSDGLATVNDSATGNGVETFTGGYITGGNGTDGGGVVVYGAFTLSAGTIIGNTAEMIGNYLSAGGVCVTGSGSSFTMDGGTIIGNTGQHGGGVYVNSQRFNMNSGEIRNNTASVQGGGVYVVGTMNLTAGVITGNKSNYIGGGVFVRGTLNLVKENAGIINISSNSVNNVAQNVYFGNDASLIIVPTEYAFDNGTQIGVTMETARVFTSGANFSHNHWVFCTYDTRNQLGTHFLPCP